MSKKVSSAIPVLVVMGVSGCGKSTVAGILAGRLGWAIAEGDDLHPHINVTKMAAGDPLTDEDRWPWLDQVRDWIRDQTTLGQPGIITCSALKQTYRNRIAAPNVTFVHLALPPQAIAERLAARLDHFMPAALLDSQLAALEPLGPHENALAVSADRPPVELADEIIDRLGLVSIALIDRSST